MGLAIAYLLYANYQLNRNVNFHKRALVAFMRGEVEIRRTDDGVELTMKKEV
jgi:hypothetical protein